MVTSEHQRRKSITANHDRSRRWITRAVGVMLVFTLHAVPTSVKAMGRLLPPPSGPSIEILCSNPVMKSAPTFLSFPKGSAKYPFTSYCTSPSVPGAMTLRREGSWTPSETRQDRPNASESITITAYEGFLSQREPGGKIIMYWTGRCDKDPWLQPSTCDRFGSYVPPDVRDALTRIDHERFPLTWNSISSSLKQQLTKQYQAANQPKPAQMSSQRRMQNMVAQPQQTPLVTQSQPTQNMAIQPQQPQVMTQSQAAQAMAVQPHAALPKPSAGVSSLSRSGIFARGVEEKESETVETSDTAVVEEGTPEIAEPVTLTLDHPFHTLDGKGNSIKLNPGIYEVGPVMNVQLAMAQQDQPTVLLHAEQDTHQIPIHRAIAVVIPGPSEDLHLLYLTPDGRRFDAVGLDSGVTSRRVEMVTPLSDAAIEKAVAAALAMPSARSSPPCRPNSSETGPRWIPVPCTMPSLPAAAVSPRQGSKGR